MTPRPTFDPDGFIDALVVDHEDGFPVTVEAPPDPTGFDLAGLHRLVDPSIPADAIPAEPGEPSGPTAADSAWWAAERAEMDAAELARRAGWHWAFAEMRRRSRELSELAPLPCYPDLPVVAA